MWYEKRDNGTYRFKERYKDPMTGKTKTVSVTLKGKTPTYQMQAADLIRAKIASASNEPEHLFGFTLHDIVSRYLDYQKNVVKDQTFRSLKHSMSSVEKLLGKDTMINKMTASYIKNVLIREGKSMACYNGRIKHIKACFRWAYSADLISDISMIDKLKKTHDPKRKEKLSEKYLEEDELSAILSGMTNNRYKLAVRMLVLSGMRVGELAALKKDDICDGYINIDKTYAFRIKSESTTKTESSERRVFIQDELAECISEINEYVELMSETNGFTSDLFFPWIDGDYFHYDAFAKYFKENCERILGKRLTVHSLRHTHTSLMAGAGISLDAISRRLGHSDSEVTKQIYLHITDKLMDRDADAIRSIRIM